MAFSSFLLIGIAVAQSGDRASPAAHNSPSDSPVVHVSAPQLGSRPAVSVGGKSFTESLILGQMVVLLARREGFPAALTELHGTRLAWSALLAGDIQIYPEYTGTIRQEILAGESLPDDESLRRRLGELGIVISRPLGFNNTYALGMKRALASRLGIRRITQLRSHPELHYGFSNEFLDRADGWPSLRQQYGLEAASVRGLEHGLAYRALDAGELDVTDVYSTDPHIRLYDLQVLDDDLQHFPRYDAVFLYRRELAGHAAELVAAIEQLEGRIDEPRMLDLSEQVELGKESPQEAAARFLAEEWGAEVQFQRETRAARVLRTTGEHLVLVLVSLSAAIVVAIPLGIAAAKKPLTGQLILGTAEVIQTIPGLALLVLIGALFMFLGLRMIGGLPVITALFLYSLLPIIRNTAAGISTVPQPLHESAAALGLPAWARLWRIELPLASPLILAGIKTTAVINVGYAALGGLIGAGGYGQPILTGLRLNSVPLMMEGAIPAALLALAVKGVFSLGERWLVPSGLKLDMQKC